jgi:predicted Zn-dependent protease
VSTGKAREGFALLEQAARDGDAEQWIEIARFRLEAKDPRAGLAAADEAVSRNPAHPWALAEKGETLIALGRREEGLSWLRKALAAGPRRPEVWLTLARAYETGGDAAAAEECRRRARAISQG